MRYEIHAYDAEGRQIASFGADAPHKAIKKAQKALDIDDVDSVNVVQKPDDKDPSAPEMCIYSFSRSADKTAVEYTGPGAEITTEAKIRRKVVESFEIVIGGETYEATRAELQAIVDFAKSHGVR